MEVRSLQLGDGAIGFILRAKESDVKPTSAEVKVHGNAARRLYKLWDRLQV